MTPWTRVATGHPVRYRTYTDPMGRFWVECFCDTCSQPYKKQCMHQPRANSWVLQFATIHGHGLAPSPQPAPQPHPYTGVAPVYGAPPPPRRGRW